MNIRWYRFADHQGLNTDIMNLPTGILVRTVSDDTGRPLAMVFVPGLVLNVATKTIEEIRHDR